MSHNNMTDLDALNDMMVFLSSIQEEFGQTGNLEFKTLKKNWIITLSLILSATTPWNLLFCISFYVSCLGGTWSRLMVQFNFEIKINGHNFFPKFQFLCRLVP